MWYFCHLKYTWDRRSGIFRFVALNLILYSKGDHAVVPTFLSLCLYCFLFFVFVFFVYLNRFFVYTCIVIWVFLVICLIGHTNTHYHVIVFGLLARKDYQII